jgi:hypothetical protein
MNASHEAIAPHDVSVVVQGPWHGDFTPRCLSSLKAALPGAETILSIWKGDPGFPGAHAVAADTVLLNDDPGPLDIAGVLSPEVERRTNIVLTNIDRQVVSTRNGLMAATRPYALKLRTDMMVEHTGFIDYFQRFRAVPRSFRLLDERVVTTNARSPRRNFCFFIQDFSHFGRTGDLRELWSAPLHPSRAELLAMPLDEREARLLVPEQHVLVTCLRRLSRMAVPMRNALDSSAELAGLTESTIANNFVCLDVHRFGVRALKPSLAWVNEEGETRLSWLWALKASYAEYVSWCERHCGGDMTALIDGFRDEYQAEMAEVPVKDHLVGTGGILNAPLLLALGERSHRAGRLAEAFNAYSTLKRASYDHFMLDYCLGVLQVQNGEAADGLANIERALARAPDFVPAYESLANYHTLTGDAASAGRWRAEAERRRPAPVSPQPVPETSCP